MTEPKWKICKVCKIRMYNEKAGFFIGDSCDYECSLTNGGLCSDCSDLQHNKPIDSPDGIFYCPKCKINTNEKTIWTTCVFCKTPLLRNYNQGNEK